MYTLYSYDLARRLLSRMADANEIARFAYGSYTSLGHPCLASCPPLPTYSLSSPPSGTHELSTSLAVPFSPAPLSTAASSLPSVPLVPSPNLCTPSSAGGRAPSSVEEKSSSAASIPPVPPVSPAPDPLIFSVPAIPDSVPPVPLDSPPLSISSSLTTNQPHTMHRASIATTSLAYTFSGAPYEPDLNP